MKLMHFTFYIPSLIRAWLFQSCATLTPAGGVEELHTFAQYDQQMAR